MKKLFVVLFVMFFAGMMMAQSNTSNVTVTGTDNNADIQQINSNNTVDAEQKGYKNSIKLEQGANPSSYKENTAEILQDGAFNKLEAYKTGSAAVQSRENYLKLDQMGNSNTAKVYQDSYDMDAYINQVGDNNTGMVFQDAHLSSADIYQKGYRNTTDINQNKEANGADFDGEHFASHKVRGNDNNVSIYQKGFNNDAIIDQTWGLLANDRNEVMVDQTNTSTGLGNRAYLRMSGSDNAITMTQAGSWNQIGNKDMYGDLGPTEVTLADMLTYVGNHSTIDISQDGNQNLVKSEMRNNNGDIDITQSGNVNKTYLDINIGGMGTGNTADIQQLSNSNTSANSVVGDRNTINVYQN